MKTVLFADLHESSAEILSVIENTIAREKPDRVVFLGDYFDHRNDDPDDTERMSRWLIKSLVDERRTHIVGNHDASYLWPGDATFCPGWTIQKQHVVSSLLGVGAGELFEFHTWVDGWLLTHAGLSATWVPDGIQVDGLEHWLTGEEKAARKNFAADRSHWFIAVGPKRGGTARAGGLLWCDHRELRPIPGIRQIYGHTPANCPRWKGNDHLCLDTALGNGPQHFAVVTGGAVEIHPFGEG